MIGAIGKYTDIAGSEQLSTIYTYHADGNLATVTIPTGYLMNSL